MGDQRYLSGWSDDYSQSKGPTDLKVDGGTAEPNQETGSTKNNSRARWSHQMKLFLIRLLKDYDVPGYRTNNAWSKEAWTNIVCRLNQKFGVSLTLHQVKQKEQDLKKDYRSVKDLLDESGFGWDSERRMVAAPDSVWDSFASRKNSKDALQWRDKSFPFYEDLIPIYEGRYAVGRTRQGMDHYASKARHSRHKWLICINHHHLLCKLQASQACQLLWMKNMRKPIWILSHIYLLLCNISNPCQHLHNYLQRNM